MNHHSQLQVSGSSQLVGSLFARVLLTGDAEAREDHIAKGAARGLKRPSTFRNYTHPEPRFRALLTEDGTRQVGLVKL